MASQTVIPSRRQRIGRSVLGLMTLIPVLMIPALEWLPWIPEPWRPWLIVSSLALAAIGFATLSREKQNLADLRDENGKMKEGIARAQPEYLLRQIASTLFGEGAWRLTVYKKTHNAASGDDRLVRLASVSSDGDQGDLSASEIVIVPATMFEFSFRSNLADPKYRRPEQSGHAPEDVHGSDWGAWRDGIFGHKAITGDVSTFRARKIAWYAAQDPDTQTVFTAIAESTDPVGILVDHLDHSFTPAWLFFVARVAELKEAASN